MATKVKERGSATTPATRVRIVIDDARGAYADGVYIAKAYKDGQEKLQLSVVMLAGNPAIEEIEAARDDVLTARYGNKRDWPRNIRGLHYDPILKACEDFPAMGIKEPGACFVRAYSNEPPLIVDAKVKVVNKADLRHECYSGRKMSVSVIIYPYGDGKTIKGVGVGLGNVQLLDHAERLGTPRPSPEDEFNQRDILDADDDEDGNEDGDDDNVEELKPVRRRR